MVVASSATHRRGVVSLIGDPPKRWEQLALNQLIGVRIPAGQQSFFNLRLIIYGIRK